MNKKEDKRKKDEPDSSVLFPVKVEGFEIKPWSFGQTIDLMPVWERVATRLQESGLKLNKLRTSEGVAKLVKAILPEAPAVLSVTLGVTEEEVRGWDLQKASVIVLTVVNLNLDHLKNLPGLVSQAVQMIQS